MRLMLLSFVIACGHAPAPPAATPLPTADASFEPLRGLVGHWQGSDPDKHSTGEFTLEPSLGGKVLMRTNRNDSPQGHHEDLMIVFATPAGLRASYFDNEGHAINYAITTTANGVEMLSDEVPNQPRFRLTYTTRGADELAIDFSIAMPGTTELKHYTGGTVHRIH